jgi:hypothetical protein
MNLRASKPRIHRENPAKNGMIAGFARKNEISAKTKKIPKFHARMRRSVYLCAQIILGL